MKISSVKSYNGKSYIELELEGAPRNRSPFIISEDSYLYDQLTKALSLVKYEVDRAIDNPGNFYTVIRFINKTDFQIINVHKYVNEVVFDGHYYDEAEFVHRSMLETCIMVGSCKCVFAYNMGFYNRSKEFFKFDNLIHVASISKDVQWDEIPEGVDPKFVEMLKDMVPKLPVYGEE